MRAGTLKERVIFDRPSRARDTLNQPIQQWEPFWTCYGSVQPISQSEQLRKAGLVTQTGYIVRTRFAPNISNLYRIRWNNKSLEIVSIIDVGNKHRELEIMAKEYADGRAD